MDAEPLRVSVRSEAAATPLPEDEPEVEEPTNFVQLSHRVITDAGRALRESFATRPSLTGLEEEVDEEEEHRPARRARSSMLERDDDLGIEYACE